MAAYATQSRKGTVYQKRAAQNRKEFRRLLVHQTAAYTVVLGGTRYALSGPMGRHHINLAVKNRYVNLASRGAKIYRSAWYKKGTGLTEHQKTIITKLRAKGASSSFPHERDAFYAKANSMEAAGKATRRFSNRQVVIAGAVVGTAAIGYAAYRHHQRHKQTHVPRHTGHHGGNRHRDSHGRFA